MVRHGEHGTRLLPAAVVAALAVAGLMVAGAFLPYATTWGFHFLAFLPRTYLAGYLLAFAVLLGYALRGDVERLVGAAAAFMGRRPLPFLALCIAAFAAFAWTMRVGAPLLGDSFYLVRNYSEAAHGVAPLYYRNEPLATIVYAALLKAFGMSTFVHFLNSFLGADILLGAGTIACLFWTVRLLVRSEEDRFLSFVFVLAFPIMQLFFGYVEIYAAVVCAVSAYLLAVALHLTGRLPFRYLPVVFLLVSLTHYGTIILAPALLYLAGREIRQRGAREVLIGAGLLATAVLSILAAVRFDLAQFSSWVPHSHLLPFALDGDPAEEYTSAFTLFSPYHFADVANLMLLVAPAALILIGFTLVRNLKALLASALHRFFLASLLPAFGLLLVIKYDLGGARDWDVFTFVYFILSLYAAIVYATSESTGRLRTTFLLAGLTFLNSYLFFSVNHRVGAAEARFQALFDRRMLSQAGYYSGSLYLAQYYHQVKDVQGPVEAWKRYNREFPSDDRGYRNILTNALRNSPLPEEETVGLFERWIAAAPDTSSAVPMYAAYCAETGARHEARGDEEGAERFFRRGAELAPSSPSALNALGGCLLARGNRADALPVLERAAALDSTLPEPFWHLGRAQADLGDRPRAMAYLARAARLGHRPAASLLRRLASQPRTNRISITEKE